MTLNLVSPGVKVREVDLTIGRIDGAQEFIGAICGPFERGPVDVPILIENEQDLISTFGKPISSDKQYEYWMSASNYLSYGGILRVVRCNDAAGLNNANAKGGPVGLATTTTEYGGDNDTTLQINSYENYVDEYSDNAQNFRFAAKDPGTWANNLKICTIDAFADQTISVSAGLGLTDNTGTDSDARASGIWVGMGVTQTLAGRPDNRLITTGTGTTANYTDGFLRGIITGISTNNDSKVISVDVKITDTVTVDGTSTNCDYEPGTEFAFEETNTNQAAAASVGIGTTTGTLDGAFDITITGITTTNIQGEASWDLFTGNANGDYVTVEGTGVGAGTTIIAIGVDEITVSQAITAGVGDHEFIFTKTTLGAVSTTNNIHIVGKTGISTSDISDTSMTVVDWYDQQKLGLTNSSVYWKTIAPKPGTSEYASKRSARNDELHVVVVDDDGSITGIDSNIIETHIGLSKASDGKISPSENIYYRDYIALKSDYLYASSLGKGVRTSVKADTNGNYGWTAEEVGNWGEVAQGNVFSGLGNYTWKLGAGKDYGSDGDGYKVDLGSVMNSYDLFKNESEYEINFLINGPSASSKEGSIAKAKKLIEIAELRKDCIATISPHKFDVVGESKSDTQTDNVKAFFSGMNSSYAVFDSTWKYQYDRWNNQFVYIPCNPDTAGLMARTSINQYSWFSPAGAARGSINNAIKLAYNPSQAQRDIIYPAAINPITFSPGSGIILFGDRTGLKYASAFDRINVRRLFLTVENTIERAARAQLFEFNDVITRTNFVNIVEPYLRDIKSKRGITDFIVVCDESNNTPDIIDANQFKADIFIKPARSINFIGLTFVATRTGVSFEEVVGNV